MIEVAVGGRSQFKGAEADIVKGLVVDTESFICVLDQLVNGEGCIVRLHDSVGNLFRQNISKSTKGKKDIR